MASYFQGFFKPQNPTKYKGDPTNIVYRSSWELKLMRYLDSHPNVIEWQSEELAIPYKSPVDGKWHRYFPDFKVKIRTAEGKINTILIEVKPEKETKPPPQPKGKMTKRYINEVFTYGKNQAKWEAARAYCEAQGWEFQIMTERTLGIKKK